MTALITEYDSLSGDDLIEVAAKVNHMISMNPKYQPLGGPAFSGNRWFQAMVLVDTSQGDFLVQEIVQIRPLLMDLRS